MELVAAGCSNKEIAVRLGLSLGTVKTYLERIYRQNNFRNRAHAATALVDRSTVATLPLDVKP